MDKLTNIWAMWSKAPPRLLTLTSKKKVETASKVSITMSRQEQWDLTFIFSASIRISIVGRDELLSKLEERYFYRRDKRGEPTFSYSVSFGYFFEPLKRTLIWTCQSLLYRRCRNTLLASNTRNIRNMRIVDRVCSQMSQARQLRRIMKAASTNNQRSSTLCWRNKMQSDHIFWWRDTVELTTDLIGVWIRNETDLHSIV